MPPPPNEQNLTPAPSGDRATIYCIYCDKPQEVSRKALQVSCKFCSKILKLEDMRFGRSSDRLHEAVLDLKHVLDFHKSLQQPASLPR